MIAGEPVSSIGSDIADLRSHITPFQQAERRRSIWQIANSFGPYIALIIAMYISLSYSYWLTLAFSVFAAGVLLRIFIIFHDCCHGSFFTSRTANEYVGRIAGFLVCTPYRKWRHDHALHHATSGDLDHRGVGDVYTMTVKEYLAASPSERLRYRLYRHPLVLLGLGPLYTFLIGARFSAPTDRVRERRSVLCLNLALAAWLVVIHATVGLQSYILIQLPILLVATTVGIWLFYVQHQFEDVYWARQDEWDFTTASLYGSTYFRLPKVLQWFTGNIGLHHVHHLSARIPNYKLQQCHDATPMFHTVPTITLSSSFKSLSLNIWDEDRQKLIGFREMRQRIRA